VAVCIFHIRAAADDTGKEAPERRGQHGAEHRPAIFDERDVDGELAVAADEFLGAVERIDEPEAAPDLGHVAGGDRFLGHHGDVGRQRLQGRDDDGLGALVGLGHRRGVLLAAHGEVGRIDLEHHVAGTARDGNDVRQQIGQ
jgi:hypothetical protein